MISEYLICSKAVQAHASAAYRDEQFKKNTLDFMARTKIDGAILQKQMRENSELALGLLEVATPSVDMVLYIFNQTLSSPLSPEDFPANLSLVIEYVDRTCANRAKVVYLQNVYGLIRLAKLLQLPCMVVLWCYNVMHDPHGSQLEKLSQLKQYLDFVNEDEELKKMFKGKVLHITCERTSHVFYRAQIIKPEELPEAEPIGNPLKEGDSAKIHVEVLAQGVQCDPMLRHLLMNHFCQEGLSNHYAQLAPKPTNYFQLIFATLSRCASEQFRNNHESLAQAILWQIMGVMLRQHSFIYKRMLVKFINFSTRDLIKHRVGCRSKGCRCPTSICFQQILCLAFKQAIQEVCDPDMNKKTSRQTTANLVQWRLAKFKDNFNTAPTYENIAEWQADGDLDLVEFPPSGPAQIPRPSVHSLEAKQKVDKAKKEEQKRDAKVAELISSARGIIDKHLFDAMQPDPPLNMLYETFVAEQRESQKKKADDAKEVIDLCGASQEQDIPADQQACMQQHQPQDAGVKPDNPSDQPVPNPPSCGPKPDQT